MWDLSRRTFIGGAAAAAGAAAVSFGPARVLRGGASPPLRAQAPQALAPAPGASIPVVGFHMDRPYLDPSGMAEPYIPPAGTRSGEALAQLDETEFLSRHPFG